MHYKRVKATYDRGYVNAMDKIRVFIESNQKVMYIGTGEYANASTAQVSYTNAINLIRASGLVRAACNRGELFFDSQRHLSRKGLWRNLQLFIFHHALDRPQ